MEEKRREPATELPSIADSPASEPPSSKRRAGGQKRKANTLNAANSSSTPSKRISREKVLPAHPTSIHNGPLTRARQIPNVAEASAAGGGSASAATTVKQSKLAASAGALGGGSVPVAEEFHKESQWEALEAAFEAEFEAIRSRGANTHVVPTHCGWFSWMHIHSIEKHTLTSFFNGKIENRTPDMYMEIRNWIMKKFHGNPNAQIELKDLLELNVGDSDARQEVMEFLDYWGLINFHPFASTDSAVASADDDGKADKNSLAEKLYHFETLQLCPPAVPKTNLMTPALSSGLFPDSNIADEVVKPEGPEVEYHCNSCSADCSRKRYHCQKQADFDLCTDCFSNGKFGSGMSILDFILMEPAEVPGVGGGKWTDQENLLLLEALELYKENWNEIAEHVATKSKAQCILHFVQMPVEDAFIDFSDDVNANCKETTDPSAKNNDSSVLKDTSEIIQSKTNDSLEGEVLTPHKETPKAQDLQTPRPEDGSDEKIREGTSKTKDSAEVIYGDGAGDACALNALTEAFEAIGYSSGPEGPSSFSEVGNPVMALAAFLVRMVGSDVAVASAHGSLKSISEKSPSIELASRHCFLLEDPPDHKKEPNNSERDSKKDGEQDDINRKQDNSMLGNKDLSRGCNDKKTDNALEDRKQLASTDDGASEKSIFSKEQAILNHEEVRHDNCHNASNSKLSIEQVPSTVQDLDGSTSKAKSPARSEELGRGNLIKEPCKAAEELKDGHVASDSLPSDDTELQQSVPSNPLTEHPQPVETPKDVEMVSDSVPSDKSSPQKPLTTNPVGESLETMESVMDIDMVSNSLPSEKNESQPPVTLDSSQHTGTEKDADMMPSFVPLDKKEPSQPVTSNSAPQNGASTGEDQRENGTNFEDNNRKIKHDNKFERVKRAAVSTLAASAVKAKLLANEEEGQIQQLATSLIEKQLHKLEKKLAFFNDVDNVVMRVREYLDRSRQKLYHERALIIASRFGLPASSSRVVPPSLPTNRIPINFANSVPRLPVTMNPQRPPVSRPMGTAATTLLNQLASATAANSIQPSSQDKVSSVGTK